MMHKNRRHIIASVATLEELAHKLTDMTWCPCNGFAFGNLLALNDATSPDGAQEYAVFRLYPRLDETGIQAAHRKGSLGELHQIESLTVSWMEKHELLSALERCVGIADEGNSHGTYEVKLHSLEEKCVHCA